MLLALFAGCTPYIQHWNAAAARPHLSGDKFVAADGVTLPVAKWLPRHMPRALIVAVHGFNDYSRAFAYMGPYLERRGIAVYAYDQRGFGAAPHRGLWPGTGPLVRDLRQFTRLIKRLYPRTPIYWLGHSMGAAVVIEAAVRDADAPVAGVILAAPAVWGDDTMNLFYRITLWLSAHTVPWMHVSARHMHIQVSDNVALLKKLSKDPLMLQDARVDTVYELVRLMGRALGDSADLRVPALVLYGANDQVIPRPAVCSLLAKLGDDPAIGFYPRGYHLLLRDLHAKRVWRDIAAWVLDHHDFTTATTAAVCGESPPR